MAEAEGKRSIGIWPVLSRLWSGVQSVAVVTAVIAFMFQLDDMKADRDARAWDLLTKDASGNSGKIEALEYLNSHHPLAIPNPRRWGVPLGPKAKDAKSDLPKEMILIRNWGPWKTRTPLTGINLSRKKNEETGQWMSAGVYLRGINLANADLSSTNLSGAYLSSANLWGANLDSANLSGVRLAYANLGGAGLERSDLSGARLHASNLSGAYLTDANLQGANLSFANLRGAYFARANLRGANLADADLSDTEFLTQDQINQTCTNKDTKLPKKLIAPRPCQYSDYDSPMLDESGSPIRAK